MRHYLSLLFILFLVFSCKKEDNNSSLEEALKSGDKEALLTYINKTNASKDSIQTILDQLETSLSEKTPAKASAKVLGDVFFPEKFLHYIEVLGNIENDKTLQVLSEYSGQIRFVVNDGQYVKRGQLIAKVNDGGLNGQLEQAKIQEELARTTYKKQKYLWNQQIGSEIQYLQTKANYQSAQKQVEILNAQLSRVNIRAPFSGILDQKLVNSGQIVSPGTPIAVLVNLSEMKAVANVPEKYLGSIKKGSDVQINIPSIGKNLSGTVKTSANIIDPSSRTFEVEVPITNARGIKPFSNAILRVNDYINPSAFIIPTNAIKQDRQDFFVFVAKPNKNQTYKVEKVSITTGKDNKKGTEVTSGINEGDIVVTEGVDKLQDGDIVELSLPDTQKLEPTKIDSTHISEKELKN